MDHMLKKTIMIVDDVEIDRSVMALVLQDKYHIIEAKHGLEAERVLEDQVYQVDLILLGIIMPVADEFDFLKWIQAQEIHKDIPIIFVTADASADNIQEGLKLGVRDVITKPLHWDVLSARVDSLIALAERRGTKTVPDQAPASRCTALIVDDVPINRDILHITLKDSYDILEAENGCKALELLRSGNKDIAVVLLDIVMPVMDGYQMLLEANRQHLLDRIPVIVITAEESPARQRLMLDEGACEVIQKPFIPAVIKSRVDHLVELYQE